MLHNTFYNTLIKIQFINYVTITNSVFSNQISERKRHSIKLVSASLNFNCLQNKLWKIKYIYFNYMFTLQSTKYKIEISIIKNQIKKKILKF